eukprot:CAMPEP_0170529672 /NCGR_PEP_ID=MMETSP0209-20121228/27790_1 /TAXON_ID=665100 ORGANISM="Litonotus pictus, Strain P1" /NCGR_SAMPLE_ID=MMETSP0209 /ASSEMBLY_ACC=CAM_ASM_000301 /LENGTH=361 /DNA_ID=CAMNT_0010821917 /DNA_START=644 /DNA_END=1729 /DNA_ORIENTATION=-
MNSKDYNKPLKKIVSNYWNSVNLDLYFYMNFYLRKVEYRTDTGFLLENIKLELGYTIDQPKITYYKGKETRIAALVVQGDQLGTKIERHYDKFQDIITKIGGLIKFLLIIADFIAGMCSEIEYRMYLLKKEKKRVIEENPISNLKEEKGELKSLGLIKPSNNESEGKIMNTVHQTIKQRLPSEVNNPSKEALPQHLNSNSKKGINEEISNKNINHGNRSISNNNSNNINIINNLNSSKEQFQSNNFISPEKKSLPLSEGNNANEKKINSPIEIKPICNKTYDELNLLHFNSFQMNNTTEANEYHTTYSDTIRSYYKYFFKCLDKKYSEDLKLLERKLNYHLTLETILANSAYVAKMRQANV